jgi:DNA-directed RNA polymerase subunit RPC12/RpoP
MAEVFYVQCPECGGRHPCHTEDLWDAGYDLLCPYCGNEFPQQEGLAGLQGAQTGVGARPPVRPA